MKKSLLIFSTISIISAGFQSCKDDAGYPVPESLTSESIKATPGSGKVTLSWDDIKDTENIYYVQCTYSITDGDKTTDYKKLASKYSTSIEIDNLLKRYGVIDFTLQTFNRDYVAGESFAVSAQSKEAEKKAVLSGKSRKIELKATDLYTDDQEATEGPIADLLDGNTNTYFHASWTNPFDMPHYIVVDLGKEIYGVNFNYTTRNHSGAGNHPKEMNVYVSKTFDGENYDTSNAQLLDNLTNLPNGAALSKQSSNYLSNDSFRYLWLEVLNTHGSTKYFAMSELSVKELFTSVYDPETGITTDPEIPDDAPTYGDPEKITLDPTKMYTNAPFANRPFSALVDGASGSFFHSQWSTTVALPHYIVVDLGKEVNAFSFKTTNTTRTNVDYYPSKMNVYTTSSYDPDKFFPGDYTTFIDGTNVDMNSANAVKVLEITSGLPNADGESFESAMIELDAPARYVWFEITETVKEGTEEIGSPYFTWDELEIFNYPVK